MGSTPPYTRRAPPTSPAVSPPRTLTPAAGSAIPVSGTMAHSWVMGFADEIDAFRQYMQIFGEHTTLLIDTYDTLSAARRIVAGGLRPTAVRLDSGDLLALSRQVRQIFDQGGLDRHAHPGVRRPRRVPHPGAGAKRRAHRRLWRRHRHQRGERRAGAGRRLQARGDDGGGAGQADREAQLRQADLSRAASRCGVSPRAASPATT